MEQPDIGEPAASFGDLTAELLVLIGSFCDARTLLNFPFISPSAWDVFFEESFWRIGEEQGVYPYDAVHQVCSALSSPVSSASCSPEFRPLADPRTVAEAPPPVLTVRCPPVLLHMNEYFSRTLGIERSRVEHYSLRWGSDPVSVPFAPVSPMGGACSPILQSPGASPSLGPSPSPQPPPPWTSVRRGLPVTCTPFDVFSNLSHQPGGRSGGRRKDQESPYSASGSPSMSATNDSASASGWRSLLSSSVTAANPLAVTGGDFGGDGEGEGEFVLGAAALEDEDGGETHTGGDGQRGLSALSAGLRMAGRGAGVFSTSGSLLDTLHQTLPAGMGGRGEGGAEAEAQTPQEGVDSGGLNREEGESSLTGSQTERENEEDHYEMLELGGGGMRGARHGLGGRARRSLLSVPVGEGGGEEGGPAGGRDSAGSSLAVQRVRLAEMELIGGLFFGGGAGGIAVAVGADPLAGEEASPLRWQQNSSSGFFEREKGRGTATAAAAAAGSEAEGGGTSPVSTPAFRASPAPALPFAAVSVARGAPEGTRAAKGGGKGRGSKERRDPTHPFSRGLWSVPFDVRACCLVSVSDEQRMVGFSERGLHERFWAFRFPPGVSRGAEGGGGGGGASSSSVASFSSSSSSDGTLKKNKQQQQKRGSIGQAVPKKPGFGFAVSLREAGGVEDVSMCDSGELVAVVVRKERGWGSGGGGGAEVIVRETAKLEAADTQAGGDGSAERQRAELLRLRRDNAVFARVFGIFSRVEGDVVEGGGKQKGDSRRGSAVDAGAERERGKTEGASAFKMCTEKTVEQSKWQRIGYFLFIGLSSGEVELCAFPLPSLTVRVCLGGQVDESGRVRAFLRLAGAISQPRMPADQEAETLCEEEISKRDGRNENEKCEEKERETHRLKTPTGGDRKSQGRASRRRGSGGGGGSSSSDGEETLEDSDLEEVEGKGGRRRNKKPERKSAGRKSKRKEREREGTDGKKGKSGSKGDEGGSGRVSSSKKQSAGRGNNKRPVCEDPSLARRISLFRRLDWGKVCMLPGSSPAWERAFFVAAGEANGRPQGTALIVAWRVCSILGEEGVSPYPSFMIKKKNNAALDVCLTDDAVLALFRTGGETVVYRLPPTTLDTAHNRGSPQPGLAPAASLPVHQPSNDPCTFHQARRPPSTETEAQQQAEVLRCPPQSSRPTNTGLGGFSVSPGLCLQSPLSPLHTLPASAPKSMEMQGESPPEAHNVTNSGLSAFLSPNEEADKRNDLQNPQSSSISGPFTPPIGPMKARPPSPQSRRGRDREPTDPGRPPLPSSLLPAPAFQFTNQSKTDTNANRPSDDCTAVTPLQSVQPRPPSASSTLFTPAKSRSPQEKKSQADAQPRVLLPLYSLPLPRTLGRQSPSPSPSPQPSLVTSVERGSLHYVYALDQIVCLSVTGDGGAGRKARCCAYTLGEPPGGQGSRSHYGAPKMQHPGSRQSAASSQRELSRRQRGPGSLPWPTAPPPVTASTPAPAARASLPDAWIPLSQQVGGGGGGGGGAASPKTIGIGGPPRTQLGRPAAAAAAWGLSSGSGGEESRRHPNTAPPVAGGRHRGRPPRVVPQRLPFVPGSYAGASGGVQDGGEDDEGRGSPLGGTPRGLLGESMNTSNVGCREESSPSLSEGGQRRGSGWLAASPAGVPLRMFPIEAAKKDEEGSNGGKSGKGDISIPPDGSPPSVVSSSPFARPSLPANSRGGLGLPLLAAQGSRQKLCTDDEKA
uniref:Uncharacterized protein n=1 Tax=Chromera velia CCMP2878 TaxID=1169474 RepID=A0A0G4FYM2_9ALVE|eukprot:Cvel_3909.t1-p1 / transcript=Cvel_3909.t1 / gene=Cvel_3909 / organism=Chromera_velia_CCMP2878 / gene_product=hypothetical protein / transcript_product=hypothetical protein / location=Cvel_scaffold165:96764-102770(+) / protein_length=1731 / sequence_SO=supercontig / SO=protein_coding / is_pseudo=false